MGVLKKIDRMMIKFEEILLATGTIALTGLLLLNVLPDFFSEALSWRKVSRIVVLAITFIRLSYVACIKSHKDGRNLQLFSKKYRKILAVFISFITGASSLLSCLYSLSLYDDH
ncbi:hypothetical protein MASR1M66_16040 [Aminivibrio sp.]